MGLGLGRSWGPSGIPRCFPNPPCFRSITRDSILQFLPILQKLERSDVVHMTGTSARLESYWISPSTPQNQLSIPLPTKEDLE